MGRAASSQQIIPQKNGRRRKNARKQGCINNDINTTYFFIDWTLTLKMINWLLALWGLRRLETWLAWAECCPSCWNHCDNTRSALYHRPLVAGVGSNYQYLGHQYRFISQLGLLLRLVCFSRIMLTFFMVFIANLMIFKRRGFSVIADRCRSIGSAFTGANCRLIPNLWPSTRYCFLLIFTACGHLNYLYVFPFVYWTGIFRSILTVCYIFRFILYFILVVLQLIMGSIPTLLD